MDSKRREQYNRKKNFIFTKLGDLPAKEIGEKYYWDVIFYRLHTSIQALMDLIAMVCKDLGYEVLDDYTNIENLANISQFKPQMINDLKKLNGLRNILVHRYNHVEISIIEEEFNQSIENIFSIIESIEQVVNDL